MNNEKNINNINDNKKNNEINFNFNNNPINNTLTSNIAVVSLRRQLFNLNNLSISDLRLKWIELYKTNPISLKRTFLIKGIAYKIQFLSNCSNTTQYELDLALKTAKQNLNISFANSVVTKKVNLIPPAGSIIRNYYKGKEYQVKVLDTHKFEYKGVVYRSLSAVASHITGVRWNGYTFFKLKKTVDETNKLNNKDKEKISKIIKTDSGSNIENINLYNQQSASDSQSNNQ
ncbi:MAG: DUF2924 domain-containing protein [Rickettsiales bacterium]|nr:DUF2924 domain-containing protein [Rickettsiales bacterium]